MGSIIRRIEEPYQQTKVTQEKAVSKSISLDERLASILPEFDSLPPDTKKGVSIDRNRMKQSLSYELLATMVPRVTAVGASFPEALSAAISRSHDSYHERGQSCNRWFFKFWQSSGWFCMRIQLFFYTVDAKGWYCVTKGNISFSSMLFCFRSEDLLFL